MAVNLKYIIDTSAYSRFFRGDMPALKRFFKPDNTLLLPIIVLGELRGGFAKGTKQSYNEQELQKLLAFPNIDVLYLSEMTSNLYGSIYADLSSRGKPIGSNDMWIAALALEHGLPLLTLDSDFQAIDGLQLVKL